MRRCRCLAHQPCAHRELCWKDEPSECSLSYIRLQLDTHRTTDQPRCEQCVRNDAITCKQLPGAGERPLSGTSLASIIR